MKPLMVLLVDASLIFLLSISRSFAGEVTHMAGEVGADRVLGGQVHVRGVAKVWENLAGNVDSIAGSLTEQVRGIARVVRGVANDDLPKAVLKLLSAYAYHERKHLANRFRLGEGLVGQCAFEREHILLTEAPDGYIRIGSGLAETNPADIVVKKSPERVDRTSPAPSLQLRGSAVQQRV